MGALGTATVWPDDPGHREAIETLLMMANAEQRWGESHRALDLLAGAERILGVLPEPYAALRRRCVLAARRA